MWYIIYIQGAPELNFKPKRGDNIDLNCPEEIEKKKISRCLQIIRFLMQPRAFVIL